MVWLRILISTSILVVLGLVVDVGAALDTIRRLAPAGVPLLLLANAAVYALLAARWRLLCRRLGVAVGFGGCLRGVYLLQVTSQVVPSLLGEAARLTAFAPDVSRRAVVKSIVLDRLANQLALVLLVTALAPRYWGLRFGALADALLLLPAIVVVAAIVVLWRLDRTRPLEARPLLARLAFLKLLAPDRRLVAPLVCGIALNLMIGVEFWLAAAALPLEIGATGANLVLAVPLLLLALALAPFSFADWGTREAVSIAILGAAGLRAEDAVAVSVVIGLTNLVSSLPGLILWLRTRSRSR